VISFIPTLLVYFALQRHFEKGIMIGSVRGRRGGEGRRRRAEGRGQRLSRGPSAC
jgi:hypothetical protein